MRTIRIDRYRIGKRALAEACNVLASGGVVAFPTETAYGLAADPRNVRAMRRVYAMKGRERGKPLPLVAGSAAQARAVGRFAGIMALLAAAHWPGPLTVVVPARSSALRAHTGDGTLAIRVPGSVWARALPDSMGHPVTSTSANRSGDSPCYSGAAVRRVFASTPDAPDLLLDAGTLPVRRPSTIVRVRRGKIEVVREGPVVVA